MARLPAFALGGAAIRGFASFLVGLSCTVASVCSCVLTLLHWGKGKVMEEGEVPFRLAPYLHCVCDLPSVSILGTLKYHYSGSFF